MYIVHVFVEVKPEYLDDFVTATNLNAKASFKEPGIARFDVLQDKEKPTSFLLVEVYRTKDDTTSHKETDHYKLWNDTVEEMMVSPRKKKIFGNIFPDEMGWD